MKHKKLHSKTKYGVVAVALILGLFIGILIIPALKDRYMPVPPKVKTAIAPDSSTAPTSTELLNQKNWIEYQAEGYPLKFKYPSRFVTNVFNEPNQQIDLFTGIDFGRMKMQPGTVYQADLAQLGYTIAVAIDLNSSLPEAQQDLDTYKTRDIFSKKEITINGLKGYRYEGTGLDSIRTTVLFEHQKLLYHFQLIRFAEDGPLVDEGEKIFEQMISSITF